MSERRPIQWATASRETRAAVASSERLVNLYAEAQPQSAKQPVVLLGTQGTARFTSLPTKPIYGLHVMGGELYVMTATKLYRVDYKGDYTELAHVTVTGLCDTADNGTHLIFVDGETGYAYSKAGGLKELSGPGWHPANSVAYLDGYFIFNRKGTGQFFISSLKGIEFDALDFATAEGAPDDVVAVHVDHRELMIGGTHTTEVWYNAGGPDFPLIRMDGAFIERGIAAPLSYASDDNTVFWLGNDRMVYRANGYQPQRVSTHAVEHSIASGTVADAHAFTFSDEGHTFYQITFPTLELTWVYDMATGLWHERQHFYHGRHAASCIAEAFGLNIVGDYQNGNLYIYQQAAHTDDGVTIQRIARSPVIHGGRTRMFMPAFELDMASGVIANTDNPQARLQYSDDGGETWSNERWASIGKTGEHLERVRWEMLG